VYTHGFDWVGFGFQDFLFNNGGLSVAFIFETDWVPEREAAVFSRSQSSFPVLCLLLCTDDCMRGDGNVCCYALMTACVVMVMVMSYLECFCRVSTLKRQFKYLYVVVVVRSAEQNESFNQSYFKYGPT
jgi:hypothetical protein